MSAKMWLLYIAVIGVTLLALSFLGIERVFR